MSFLINFRKPTRLSIKNKAYLHGLYLATFSLIWASAHMSQTAYAQGTDLPAIEIDVSEDAIDVGNEINTLGAPPAGIQASDFSGASSTVSASDIEKINAYNVEDALKYEPNLFVRKRFTGDNNAPIAARAMHHFQTGRALVYADGLLLSNFLGANFATAPRWSVVAPHEIESIDVLYGPFSAQLPGNSMGVTVQMNTKMPTGPEAYVEAHSFHQNFNYYGTDDTFSGKKFYGSVGGKEGDTSVRFSINHVENDSQPMSFRYLRDGGSGGPAVTGAFFDQAAKDVGQRSGFAFGAQDFHTTEDTLLKTKLRHKFNEQWSADLTLAYWNSKNAREKFETYLRDENGNKVFTGDVTIDGQNFTIRNSDLQYRIQEKQDLLAGLTLYGNNVHGFDIESTLSVYSVLDDKTRRAGGFTQSLTNGSGRIDDAEGTGWQTFDIKASRRVLSNVLFTTGYHFNHYKLENESNNTEFWRQGNITSFRNATGGETLMHGLFAEAKYRPLSKVEITTGLRYDYWEAFDGFLRDGDLSNNYDDRDEDGFSPKLGLTYFATDNLTLDFGAGRAIRFPTVGELFQGDLDSDGEFDPNSFDPNLKPEESTDFHISATQKFGGSSIKGTAFLSYVDDTIFSQQGVNPNTGAITRAFLNIPEMRNYGFEVAFHNKDTLIKGLQIHANGSYTRAEIRENPGNLDADGNPDTEGNQFPRVPYWRAAVTVSYDVTNDLTVSAGYRFSSDPFTDLENELKATTFGYTSGFSILDLKAQYEIYDGIELNFGVDNVTDDEYFAFHPLPGRTFTAGLKGKF